MKLDLNIGQRLAIGFTLMLLVFAGLLIAVSRSQQATADAEAALSRGIGPLHDKTLELERAVYRLGIDTRAYLISPDDLNSDTQRNAVARLQALRSDLRELVWNDPANRAPLLKLDAQLDSYIAAAGLAMEQRRHGSLGLRPERVLGDAREKAIAAIGIFSERQGVKSQMTLSNVRLARERLTAYLQIGLAVGIAVLICVFAMTARAIVKPARALVRLAQSLEQGTAPVEVVLGKAAPPTAHEARDEIVQLGRALQRAAFALDQRERRQRAERDVAAAVLASLDERSIADGALAVIVEHLRADAGAVYARDADLLLPIANYAMEGVGASSTGVGLVGQVAESGRAIVRDGDAALAAQLGFGERAIKTVVAVPLRTSAEVIGVLIIGSIGPIPDSAHAFIRCASDLLSAGLRNALIHQRGGRHAADTSRPAPVQADEAGAERRSVPRG